MAQGGIVLVLVLAALALLGVASFMLWLDTRRVALERRVSIVSNTEAMAAAQAAANEGSLGNFFIAGLRRLGNETRQRTRIFSEQEISDFERTVAAAGFNPKGLVPVLLGAKMALMIMGPIAAYLVSYVTEQTFKTTVMAVLGAMIVGVLGPNWLLQFARKPYLKALAKGLPDALDLMVICSEAGQGLETAVNQVAKEMAYSNPVIATEFTMLANELSMLSDRYQALHNLGLRSGSDGLKRLSAILLQTMQFGTPLTQGLRAVAGELRRERMTALEAKAARLPALMVVPMILFIMPCLFVVLIGPSIIKLMDALVAY